MPYLVENSDSLMVLGDTEGVLGMKRMEKAHQPARVGRLPAHVRQRRLLRLPQAGRLGRLDVTSGMFLPSIPQDVDDEATRRIARSFYVVRMVRYALLLVFLVVFLVAVELKGGRSGGVASSSRWSRSWG